MLSRFLVLVALYTSCMFIGNMHFRTDDVRLTGQHRRTFVAALQVMIVSALLCVHTLFMFFIRIVKQERTAFVLVSHLKATQGGQEEGERAVCVEETGTPAASEREMCDASSVRVDAESETLSVSDGGMNIVFASSLNLDLYFLYVTLVGLVLWTTFVAFNFALYDSFFVVASGMVVGWIMNQMSSECRCHESQTPRKLGEKLRTLFYCCVSVLIVSLGLVNVQVPQDMSSALIFYAQAFCAGVFWTAVAHEVAFTGGQNVSRGVLYSSSSRADSEDPGHQKQPAGGGHPLAPQPPRPPRRSDIRPPEGRSCPGSRRHGVQSTKGRSCLSGMEAIERADASSAF